MTIAPAPMIRAGDTTNSNTAMARMASSVMVGRSFGRSVDRSVGRAMHLHYIGRSVNDRSVNRSIGQHGGSVNGMGENDR